MEYFNSEYFYYKNDGLYCENAPVTEIADKYGTPLYIYSKNFLIDRYKEFENAFKELNHAVFFACKSNFNLSVIKTFGDLGCGVDVNSEGELYRAFKAGVPPGRIIFSGVGKTVSEIKLAIDNNLLMIKAESLQELELINEIAESSGKTASVAVRVNPDVDAKTHPYISTGLAENKFGIDSESAFKVISNHKRLKNLNFVGIDMHIGSQITSTAPYVEAVEKLSELYLKLIKYGVELRHLDLGGGIGVKYKDERTFSISQLAAAIKPVLEGLKCDVFFEPGRFLTANSGILVAQVLYTKKNNGKNFIVADAAMNDLLRPSIYGAYHHIQPVKINGEREEIIADVVGPVCESGDFLAKNRKVQANNRGDLIAVMSAGAYSMVMTSNYNGRRRPAEVMVYGEEYKLVRSRETFQHLIFDEDELLRK